MNTTNNPSRRGSQRRPNENGVSAAADLPEQNFEDMTPQGPIVEHLSIPGFLRRIEKRWDLEDIRRFGNKVGHMAESMQLSFRTAMNRDLGELRIFPEPLLRRVYDIMGPQFGWPKIEDAAPALESAHRVKESVKAREKLGEKLREVIGETDNPDIISSLSKISMWLESETQRMRETIISGPPSSAPLRAL